MSVFHNPYPMDQPCHACGHRFGLHRAVGSDCPKDGTQSGRYRNTVFAPKSLDGELASSIRPYRAVCKNCNNNWGLHNGYRCVARNTYFEPTESAACPIVCEAEAPKPVFPQWRRQPNFDYLHTATYLFTLRTRVVDGRQQWQWWFGSDRPVSPLFCDKEAAEGFRKFTMPTEKSIYA